MLTKKCIGCYREVEDKINSLGIATICDSCRVPLEIVPQNFIRERECYNCKGKVNLIGAFTFKKAKDIVCLYYDCPNPLCSARRMTIVKVDTLKLGE
jgi:hypothetical protein